ncbi:hypothetical protein [Paenibacillus chitinolyticus]|uniref:hypothetical protein n=1 Tax=Paenibacillus chitinolyticus TaxID=79263 RepID=UPI003CFD1CBF
MDKLKEKLNSFLMVAGYAHVLEHYDVNLSDYLGVKEFDKNILEVIDEIGNELDKNFSNEECVEVVVNLLLVELKKLGVEIDVRKSV